MDENEQALLRDGRVHPGMRVRHIKSGGQYYIVSKGKIEKTLEEVMIYCSVERADDVWVRPLTEFCDGRFEVM
jgi:hypothetical protein